MIFDFSARREAEALFQARYLARLDFIERMIAAHQQQPDSGLDHIAGLVALISGQHQ